MVENSVYMILSDSMPVTAIVGTKIEHAHNRQSNAAPRIVITNIDQQSEQAFNGPVGLYTSRIQIDCYATTRAQLKSMKREVFLSLAGFAGMVGEYKIQAVIDAGGRDLTRAPYDASDEPLHRWTHDFIVWYNDEVPVGLH